MARRTRPAPGPELRGAPGAGKGRQPQPTLNRSYGGRWVWGTRWGGRGGAYGPPLSRPAPQGLWPPWALPVLVPATPSRPLQRVPPTTPGAPPPRPRRRPGAGGACPESGAGTCGAAAMAPAWWRRPSVSLSRGGAAVACGPGEASLPDSAERGAHGGTLPGLAERKLLRRAGRPAPMPGTCATPGPRCWGGVLLTCLPAAAGTRRRKGTAWPKEPALASRL